MGSASAGGISVPIPEEIDWMFWRIASHPDISSGLAEIKYKWTCADLIDAHMAIDTKEALDSALSREQARAMKMRR